MRANVSMTAVRAAMPPLTSRGGKAILKEAERYLEATRAEVVPLYRLLKAGGLSANNRALVAFTVRRVAAGAAELRDLTVAVWRVSAKTMIGYPPTPVADIERGKSAPFPLLYGTD